jgi:hypothetical protein
MVSLKVPAESTPIAALTESGVMISAQELGQTLVKILIEMPLPATTTLGAPGMVCPVLEKLPRMPIETSPDSIGAGGVIVRLPRKALASAAGV